MHRRTLLQTPPLLAAATLDAEKKAKSPHTVGVLGHTGRGNYGHGLDTVWLNFPQTHISAVADPNPAGLAKARKRLGNPEGFTDYHELLLKHRPDIVAICPRHPDQHRDMAIAACQNGAKGIYMEKPFCRTIGEAIDIQKACDSHGTKLAIAHRNRYHPLLPKLQKLIQDGLIGKPVEIRSRGKEDRRGGGEDLWVLGTHVLNLARQFTGKFLSCSATLLQDGRPVTKKDCREGGEALGTLAGNQLHARYQTESGIPVYFDSIQHHGQRDAGFGFTLIGNEGQINIRCDKTPLAYYRKGTPWNPTPEPTAWQPIGQDGPGTPHFPAKKIQDVHRHITACNDLFASMQDKARLPLCNHLDGKETVEMVVATFESHRQGGKAVPFPIQAKDNPLDSL